jgi:hypothetical protein
MISLTRFLLIQGEEKPADGKIVGGQSAGLATEAKLDFRRLELNTDNNLKSSRDLD